MMTALIKMGQIEKGCVTMELYNDLPAGLCAHTGLSPRQIERREEGGAKERKAEERKETRREGMESKNEDRRQGWTDMMKNERKEGSKCLSVSCGRRKER